MPPSKPKPLLQRILDISTGAKIIVREQRRGVPYKTVSHDDVTSMLKPLLLAEGVLALPDAIEHHQNGNRTEVSMRVKVVCADNPDDFIYIPSLGYGVDSGDKGPGKAISYAFKYALLKAFLLETGDDPDTEPHRTHTPENNSGNRKPDQGAKADELPF